MRNNYVLLFCLILLTLTTTGCCKKAHQEKVFEIFHRPEDYARWYEKPGRPKKKPNSDFEPTL